MGMKIELSPPEWLLFAIAKQIAMNSDRKSVWIDTLNPPQRDI
jgi:hypothetical protein